MQITGLPHCRLLLLLFLLSQFLHSCGLVDEPTSSTTCIANCTSTDIGSSGTGVFVDSEVQGISYQTTSGQSGTTNASGQFDYLTGDQVTFTIGSTTLGQVTAASVLTPVEVAGVSDSADQRVINMSRFLQTLDDDGDPSNGIGISAATVTSLGSEQFNFNQSVANFTSSSSTSISTKLGRSLVSAQQAINHLNSTLKKRGRGSKIANPSKLASLIPGYKPGAFFCEAKGSASCNSNTASKFDAKSVFIK